MLDGLLELRLDRGPLGEDEAADALLVSPQPGAFIELSQAPGFRRGWPSLYAAFRDGQIDRAALRPDYDLSHYRQDEPKTTEERFACELLAQIDAATDPAQRAAFLSGK